ncbi:MAG: hypothetical protein EXX96DRAFT_563483 [Benjaminiella poitrasii]|nr:MAG: hypothetical protein EXX96DRAFT_563483 [Benjaminiella poitrasii]
MKFFGIVTAAFVGALMSMSSALPISDPSTTPFYITAPLNNTVYTSGTTAITTWRNGIPGTFSINVLQGSDPELLQNTNITLTGNGATGAYAWLVPEYLVGGTYAFRYIYTIDGISGESYSNLFKVVAPSDP